MQLLPLKRKNQAHREVQDDEGIVWQLNKHGVAYRHEPDPHFEGWQVTVFPERYMLSVDLRDYARDNDPTWKRCKCC